MWIHEDLIDYSRTMLYSHIRPLSLPYKTSSKLVSTWKSDRLREWAMLIKCFINVFMADIENVHLRSGKSHKSRVGFRIDLPERHLAIISTIITLRKHIMIYIYYLHLHQQHFESSFVLNWLNFNSYFPLLLTT